jgi:hypothetical protein
MHSSESRHRHITIYLFWSNPVNPRCHGSLRLSSEHSHRRQLCNLNHHATPKSKVKCKNQLLSRDADNLSRELFSTWVMKSPTRTPWSSCNHGPLGYCYVKYDTSLWSMLEGTETDIYSGVSSVLQPSRARILVGLHLDWSLIVLLKVAHRIFSCPRGCIPKANSTAPISLGVQTRTQIFAKL